MVPVIPVLKAAGSTTAAAAVGAVGAAYTFSVVVVVVVLVAHCHGISSSLQTRKVPRGTSSLLGLFPDSLGPCFPRFIPKSILGVHHHLGDCILLFLPDPGHPGETHLFESPPTVRDTSPVCQLLRVIRQRFFLS